MVGLFHQPEFVICDPELLKTLPQKEIRMRFGGNPSNTEPSRMRICLLILSSIVRTY